jgi:glycerol-3-phosphate cytidylyltransferase-like family protein
VDTRSKIVIASETPPEGTLVVGYFDVLGVEHVRALRTVRERGSRVIVVVLPDQDSAVRTVVGQQGRAEMAAALRMVDYVLICAKPGQPGDLEDLMSRLRPKEIVSLKEAESRRMHQLMEQVAHGQRR